MDNSWFEDMYKSFVEREHGDADLDFENITDMVLHIQYGCESKGLKFSEVLQRARALEQMFDDAENLVKEGFYPPQVSVILQHHFDREA